jgi:hypothetical protein
MTFSLALSSSAIAYFLLSLVLGFLTFRFRQYLKQRKDIVSRGFFYFSLVFFAFALVRMVTFSFAESLGLNFLVISASLSAFLQGLAAAIVVHMILTLKSARISPWFGFWTIFALGVATAAINIFLKPSLPHIASDGSVTWILTAGITPIIYYVLRMSIIFMAFIPLVTILLLQFKNTTDPFLRNRSFGLICVTVLAIIIGMIDFIFVKAFHVSGLTRDVVMGILSILLFVVTLLTQKNLKNNEN